MGLTVDKCCGQMGPDTRESSWINAAKYDEARDESFIDDSDDDDTKNETLPILPIYDDTTLLLLNETLKQNIYPNNEINMNTNKSLMAKYCTNILFDELKDLQTENGYTFALCINAGVKNPESIIGCYAGDLESYTMFGKFFNAVIRSYHNFDIKHKSQPMITMDASKLKNSINERSKEVIISTRIEISRNLMGHCLSPGQSDIKQKQDIESVFIKVFEYINSTDDDIYTDYKGTYYGLYNISETKKEELNNESYLFNGNNSIEIDAGYHKWFPNARGIYINNNKTFLCWINAGDHITFISLENSGNVSNVYDKLARGCNIFEDIIKEQGLGNGYLKNDKLGYITCSPGDIGTGLKGTVQFKLDNLNETSIDSLGTTANGYHCIIKEVMGNDSNGEDRILNISNKHKLGYSENDLIDMMINGVNKFVEMNDEIDEMDDGM